MTPPHIEEIARAVKDLSYGELSMTQATDIATLTFNMSTEICAKRIEPRGKRPCDCGKCRRCTYGTSQEMCVMWDLATAWADAIRALASETSGAE